MTSWLLVLATACLLLPAPERGELTACLEGPGGELQDTGVSFMATVGPAPAAGSACDATRTLALSASDGTAYVLGFAVRDDDGVDITPQLEVDQGDEISLLYRNRLVWGDVSGFVLEDFEGALVLAADEGSWGGALDPGDVQGLSVEQGKEVVAKERGACQPIEGFEIAFSADDDAVLVPVDSEVLHIGGQPFTAVAVAAWDYGESRTCSISDATGFLTWAVYR